MSREILELDDSQRQQAQDLLQKLRGIDVSTIEGIQEEAAEKVKTLLSDRASQLAQLGLFPQGQTLVADEQGERIIRRLPWLEVDQQHLSADFIILTPSGELYECPFADPSFLILDWDHRRPAEPRKYLEFGLSALDAMERYITDVTIDPHQL